MLDVGFSELLLIAVVALVVVGPKDLPVVMRHVMKFVRELSGVYQGLKKQMHDVMEESGVNEMKKGMTTIIDLDGNPQQAYDVSDLTQLSQPSPPPSTAATPVRVTPPATPESDV